MLTKLTVRNFKRFGNAEIELGNPVVFVGPNNSGKTTALQALALWNIGVKRWNEKRAGKKAPEKRPGVTINRRDLIAIPVPHANLLWQNLHVRDTNVVKAPDGGVVKNKDGNPKTETQNVRIDIIVEGTSEGHKWECGLEFDYANEESFYCRPLRRTDGKDPERMAVPDAAFKVNIAFLPPMSGLASNEIRLDPGAVNVKLGEGRTAEVLRNLCYRIATPEGDGSHTKSAAAEKWNALCDHAEKLFGIRLDQPRYVPERGEIAMTYIDQANVRLDLSAAGRGLQQTLLLLAYLTVNPGAVLLIDEPDAHLEILRQREIYQLLSDMAKTHSSQIIIATHSEIVLNEAADRDVVVAFVGRPHRIDDRGQQVLKSLKEIGFDQYYQAEEAGWILYLEGSTDLAILRAFATILDHPAQKALERPFVHYVLNQPNKARSHFFGLQEAKSDLVAFALFDKLTVALQTERGLHERMWSRREIENYLCDKDVLLAWANAEAKTQGEGPLFSQMWVQMMTKSIAEIEAALMTLGKGSPWSPDVKVTDDFLEPLFKSFFKRINLPNELQKTNYHVLAQYVSRDRIDPEVNAVLDDLYAVTKLARSPAP